MIRLSGYGAMFTVGMLMFLEMLLLYPSLPEKVASHFGANGVADGWTSKATFGWTMFGLAIGVPFFLIGLMRILPSLPASMINLPNREYWLAPERKSQTFAFVEGAMAWMGAATLLLMLGIFYLTYRANIDEQPLSVIYSYTMLGVYLAVVLGFVVSLIRRFRKT